ncbi:hypothetical protein Misp01_69830 [Microtetraspora sp. NBRC 13810]|uniref:prepilin peptidase n=1 Tax=Microtetraspora sp. NBRC 13810 TaxID=3030990 RepID=UPI0024A4E187|nr:A24 family peptidase [Microtetraspora sp. NBRC 13810]GLW11855.1 hypothetical protein Misp01_69830 [Microtetraspora sp. NBRC 13810]
MLTPLMWTLAVAGAALAAGGWQRAHLFLGVVPDTTPGAPPAYRPARFSVEVVTGLLLAGLAVAVPSAGVWAAFGWLAVCAVPLALVDVAVFRLPDRLTAAAYAGTLGLLAVTAVAERRHDELAGALLGGLAVSAFYLVLFLVNPAGMGLGDVKLGAALGTALGWLGWASVVAGVFAAHLAAGLYGLAMIVTRRGSRKSDLPFGPFMILGTLAAIFTGGPW